MRAPKTPFKSTSATAVIDIPLERAKGAGNLKHIRFVGMYGKFRMRGGDAKHVSDTSGTRMSERHVKYAILCVVTQRSIFQKKILLLLLKYRRN